MKKTGKLLLCLLSVMLLVGTFCIFAYAEDEPARVVFPTVNTDFEKWSYSNDANEKKTSGEAKGLQVAVNGGSTFGVFSSERTANDENTYAKFWNSKGNSNGTTGSHKNPWFGIYAGNYSVQDWKFNKYDYITIDFEFGSDEYIYRYVNELGDVVFLTAEELAEVDASTGLAKYDAEKAHRVLAYPLNGTFDMYTRGVANSSLQYTSWTGSMKMTFVLKENANYDSQDPSSLKYEWYLQSYGGPAVKLSQEAGVWNHITYVMAIDNTPIYQGGEVIGWNLSNSDAHVYMNGELFVRKDNYIAKSATANGTTYNVDTDITMISGDEVCTALALDQIRVQLPTGFTPDKQSYSICFDNIRTYYYEDGYVGGISEIMKDTTKKLAEADDVRASDADFKRPYPIEPVSKINGVEGAEYFYYHESAFHYIERDSVLELYKQSDSVCNVKVPFIVKTNGYGFNYYSDSHEPQRVGDTIYFVYTTDPVRVIFDGDPNIDVSSDRANHPFYDDSTKLALGAIPKYPNEITDSLRYRYVDGQIWEFVGWSTQNDATEPMQTLPAITQEDIYYGCYYIYPVYKKTTPVYTLQYQNGSDTVTIGYHSYDTLEESLQIEGAKISFGGTYTKEEILVIEKNITIDTNGNNIRYTSSSKIADVSGNLYTFRDVTDAEKVSVQWFSISDTDFTNPIGEKAEIPGNTIDYTVFNRYQETQVYSTADKKIRKFTGWSTETDNAGTALSDGLYTIPRDISFDDGADRELGLYPTYDSLDCKFYVVYNGVETGYISYDNLEDFTTRPGSVIYFKAEFTDFLYIDDDVTLVPYLNNLEYYSERKIADTVEVPDILSAGNTTAAYKFRTVRDSEKVSVQWTDLNGIVQKTEQQHIPGNTIETPRINQKIAGNVSQTLSNDFYKVYLAWKKTYKVLPLDDGGVNPNVFKPTNETDVILEVDIKNINYSFSVLSDFKLNLYVPNPKNDKVRILNANATEVQMSGKDYILISDVLSIKAFETGEFTASIEYSLDGSADFKEVTVSIPGYFNDILSKTGVTTEEKNLVIAAAKYCNEIYKSKNGEYYAPYTSIVTENQAFFDSIDTIIEEDAGNYTNATTNALVKAYITGAKMYYNSETNSIGLEFTVKPSVTINRKPYTVASLSANGMLAESQYGIRVTINGVEYGTRLVQSGSEYKLVLDTSGANIPVYALSEAVKFTVYKLDIGANAMSKVTSVNNKTYAMAHYLASNPTEDVSMLKTLYTLSYTARQYNESLSKADDNSAPALIN